MPYKVEKRGNRWAIVKNDTGEVVGHSDSKEDAEASVRARLAAEHGATMGQQSRTERARTMWTFLPIIRVDDERRELEAYGFVNEKVPGQKWRLKRAAMEAATPGYMEWANIREMHEPSAVGTAQIVEWDDKGAHMICRVVDDDAWTKVKERVYKGLSVGVNPVIVRGEDVEKCDWIETSLVDRPRDPDAKISLVRLQGADEEVDVQVLPAPVRVIVPDSATDEQIAAVRAAFADASPDVLRAADAPDENGAITGDTHYDCGNPYGCCGHTTRGGAQECRQKQQKDLDQQIEWLNGRIREMQARRGDLEATIQRGTKPAEKEDGHKSPPQGYPESRDEYADPTNYKYPIDTEEHVRAAWSYINKAKNREGYSAEELAYIEGRIRARARKLGIEISEDDEKRNETAELRRAETAETELRRVQAAYDEQSSRLRAAEERLERLAREPAPMTKPIVRFPEAADRRFLANDGEGTQVLAETLLAEYRRLEEAIKAEKEPEKRSAGVQRMLLIGQQLAALGIKT